MGVYALFGEGVNNGFEASLVYIRGRMEMKEILVVLVLEGRNAKLEKLETSLVWFQFHHQK